MNFLLKKCLTVYAILLTFTFTSRATNYTWTGAVSSNWDNHLNWSGGTGIPGSTDNIIISSCSTSAYQLVIDTTVTIATFTMTACTLTINSGYTLNITGTTSIIGSGTLITGAGTLNIGTSTTAVTVAIGSTSVLNGPTVSPASITIYASLSGSLSYICNSTFGACSIYWLGSGYSSNGGNTFTGTTYIGFSGFGGLNFGVNKGDTFEGQTTFSNTGSGASSITISSNYSSIFSGNIIVICNNSGGYGIVFGSPTGSPTSTLDSGYTISAGTFSSGFLKLYNFIQKGTTPQTLSSISNLYFYSGTVFNGPLTTTGSTSLYFNSGAIFAGTVTASAAYLYLNGSHFKNVTNLTETWGGNNSNGGNTFDGATTINNNGGGGSMNLNNISSDTYNGNVTYNNYHSNLFIGKNTGNTYNATVTFNNNAGVGNLWASYMGITHYNGDIIINNTTNSSQAIVFGLGGGTSILDTGKTITADTFAVGALSLSNFTQLGNTSQNITLTVTGTASLGFGNCIFNGPLTATAPVVTFGGNTFYNRVSFTTTATSSGLPSTSGGGNTFDSATAITNSSAAALNISNTNPDIFNSTLSITNNSGSISVDAGNTYKGTVTITNASSSSGNLYMSNNNTTTSNFYGNIILNNSSYYGINFGQFGGASVLASGNTITAPTFTTGGLNLKNFTQQGTTAQHLDVLGGTLTITNSVFSGNFESTSLSHNIGTTQFYDTSSFTKTGTSLSSWAGGNTFHGVTTFTNQNGGILELSTAADLFDSSVTFINNGSSGILVNYSSVSIGNTYTGTVTMTNNSSTGYIYLSYTSGSIYSYYNGNIVVNGTGATQNCVFAGGLSAFMGTNAQSISDSYSGGLTIDGHVIVNKPSGAITLYTPVTISGAILTLTKGNIITTSGLLTLNSSASVSGGGTASFVSGPMAKVGNTAFTFPIGTGTTYAPIGISSLTGGTSSTITAQYFRSSPLSAISAMVNSPLKDISDCEYWSLNSSSTNSAIITLPWSSGSCSLNNYNVFEIAGSPSVSPSWSVLTSAVASGSGYTHGSMATTSSLSIPTSTNKEYLTYGYKSKLVLNTVAVNPAIFTVAGADSFPPSATFTSGSSGAYGGILTVHPNLSANATLGIEAGANNSAENIQVGVNSSGDPNAVSSQFQGTYYPMSPSYYRVSTTGDTVIFSKQKTITPPLAITTNLINGLVFNHATSNFQVTVPGFSSIALKIYDTSGTLKYSGTGNTWSGTGVSSPGTYKFQVIVNGTATYTGQLLYK